MSLIFTKNNFIKMMHQYKINLPSRTFLHRCLGAVCIVIGQG